MSLQEINNRMIEIEEKINLDEHRLSLPLASRLDRENNRNEDIMLRLERLENEWDRLAILMND